MNLTQKPNKKFFTVLAAAACFTAFFLCSLSCASAPRQKTVKIADIQSWAEGTTVSVPCDPSISVIQWKLLVKELADINELDNINLSPSKSLTALNLESTVKVSGTPLKYVYSLNSADKEITLEILSIEEVDSEADPLSATMTIDEVTDYKANVVKKFTNDLTAHGKQLVEKKKILEY